MIIFIILKQISAHVSVSSDTSQDNLHQVDVERHQVDVERLMGDEIDQLKSDIERKDNEILEKNKALDDLQRQQSELDEKLKEAQQDITQNQTLIAYLNESKQGLTKQLKQCQDELEKLKADKKTFKNTVDFLVSSKSRIKKTVVNRFISLQEMIACEQNKVSALKQAATKYEERIENLMQEKRTLEHRNTELEQTVMDNQSKLDTLEEEHNVLVSKVANETILHGQKVTEMERQRDRLREHIDRAERAIGDQKRHYQETIWDLQERLDATQSQKADQKEQLPKKIESLDINPMGASATTPIVSSF